MPTFHSGLHHRSRPHGHPRRHATVAVAGTVLLALIALLVFMADEARAGQILWSKGGQIWTMNDDGTNQRVLVPLSAAPGMTSLRTPSVHPGGTVVAFEGSTTANQVTRTGLCGTFPNTYSCTTFHYGFNGTGVYRLESGVVTRLTPAPAYCWNCSASSNQPEPKADGSIVHLFDHCQGFLDDGTYDCVSAVKDTAGTVFPSCSDVDSPAPNPANGAQVVFTGCFVTGQPALVVTSPGGAGEHVIGCDEATQWDPSWSAAGDLVVASEISNTDPGLWIYGTSNTDCTGAVSRYALSAPASVSFDSPRFVGSDRIVFGSGGELWSIAASCNGCVFPANATQLTTGGDNYEPAWTAAAPAAVPPVGAAPTPTPAPTPPAGGTGTPGADTTPPVPVLRKTAKRQRVLKQSRRIIVKASANEAATIQISGKIELTKKTKRTLKAISRPLPATITTTIKIKLTSKMIASLRAQWAKRRVPVAVLKVRVVDAAGNATESTRRISLAP